MISTPAWDTLTLPEDAADAYLDRVDHALRAARLNLHYAPSRALQRHLQAMHSRHHRGLHAGGLEVDPRGGLPTYREWVRVQSDAAVAPASVEGMPPVARLEARAAQQPDGVHARQLRKLHYYRFLMDGPVAPLSGLSVALRRVDADRQTASFQVVYDKLDARGLFVRYTIDLTQRASRWSRALVNLEEDIAAHTEDLRGQVSRFASLDAEFAFVRLSANPSLDVERVFKGTIGPLCFGHTPLQCEANPLAPLLSDDPRAVVGSFSLDIASRDVAEDGDNDPIEDLMVDSLSDEAREAYEEARAKMGYHVFKDRKFVADRASVPRLRRFCEQAGTQNVIYTPRGGRRG